METKQAKELLQKYLDHECSPVEKSIVESWYNAESKASDTELHHLDYDQLYLQLANSLPAGKPAVKVSRMHSKTWITAIAAVVATIIFGAGLFYYYHQAAKTDQVTTYANDVPPGKQRATLTLANGQKIVIDDALSGNIASQSGVNISKTADGQIIYDVTDQNSGTSAYNTLSTSAGEQIQVRLPDGSLVFLNAASSLEYPVSFTNLQTRRVHLTGEGYFEISKSYTSLGGHRTRQSFVVESKGQQVEVLGTHFNINSYADEPVIATTLLEGSVKVSQAGKDVILKPGQQALNKGDNFTVRAADLEAIADWKNGDFYLDKVNFKVAMRKIARWYNVEVVYDDSIPEDMEAGGWVSRSSNLSSILKLIESSGLVHFKVDGRTVYVFK